MDGENDQKPGETVETSDQNPAILDTTAQPGTQPQAQEQELDFDNLPHIPPSQSKVIRLNLVKVDDADADEEPEAEEDQAQPTGRNMGKGAMRRIAAIERQKQALLLRKAGFSYQQIADQLKYGTAQGAYKAVQRALERMIQEPAEELLRVELERLDTLQAAVWGSAIKGNLGAVDRVLKIMDKRHRLEGLEKPVKVAPTDPTGEREYQELSETERAARVLDILERAKQRAKESGQGNGNA